MRLQLGTCCTIGEIGVRRLRSSIVFVPHCIIAHLITPFVWIPLSHFMLIALRRSVLEA
jgi:hypothetical protein